MKIAFAGFRHNHIYNVYRAAVANPEVTIAGCFEADAQTRKNIEALLGATFNFQSYEEILNDKTIDIVAVGDYYTARGKLIIEALKSGKHVISDKPLCTDLDELAEIEQLSKEKNLQVCCMLDLRYMPQAARAKALIESGEIGDVHIISFTGQHCLDYGNRAGWYFETGKHGGTINDIAIHGLDLLRYITGKNLTKINCAKTWNAFALEEPDFKDCGQFMVEMDNIAVMADVSYAAPKFNGIMPTYWNFKFWGTKGMLTFSYADNKIYLYKNAEEVIDCGSGVAECLGELLKDISGTKTLLNKDEVLPSQKQILLIQQVADQNE